MTVIGKLLARKGILSKREQEVRAREQELLERLATALERFGSDVATDDLRRFQEAREQLTGLLPAGDCGRVQLGKVQLHQCPARRAGAARRSHADHRPHQHSPPRTRGEPNSSARHIYWSGPIPRRCCGRSTSWTRPGTNAIIRRHEELTRDFVPRSDLVLFVTSADRPFTESERAFLEQIREWGKKIVFIVNKIDILTQPAERDEVLRYVEENAAGLLGETPRVFAVSARHAMRRTGRRVGRAERMGRRPVGTSGFGEVEDYLLNTLDQEERVRLKLLNPSTWGYAWHPSTRTPPSSD